VCPASVPEQPEKADARIQTFRDQLQKIDEPQSATPRKQFLRAFERTSWCGRKQKEGTLQTHCLNAVAKKQKQRWATLCTVVENA
jgi:hypothetical protein